MELTKNEKKVVRLLLDNARITDSAIAEKLKISSQAVGKIRRKLERSIIDSYKVDLNYSKMGIKTFAISLSKMTPEGLDGGELEVEKKLLENPNIIQVYRLPQGKYTHAIFYGFLDVDELDEFFHSTRNKKEMRHWIENEELFTFSHNSLIKNNPLQLFDKIIEGTEKQSKIAKFSEIEKFKNRL